MESKDIESLPGKSQKHGKSKYPSYHMQKRSISKLPKRENDVYVTRRTTVQCQLSKCQKLFEDGHTEIVIHGLGAAINTAVNLSLILQEKLSHTVELAVNTSTVELFDDFLPNNDNEEPFSRKRSNSAIHIKINRKPNL